MIGVKLTATDYKKLRRRQRLERTAKHRSHLKFLADNYYSSLAAPIDKDGNYVCISKWFPDLNDGDSDIAYYKRLYRGRCEGNWYQFYKKYANKVVRLYRGEIHKGSSYKKCFDYWWTVD